jgi:anhydro-N-acetylmuramic acid kinase
VEAPEGICWRQICRKPERLVLGIMTGSSMDGIDMVVCRVVKASPGQFSFLASASEPYPQDLREALLPGGALELAEAARLHRRLGEWFAAAALRFVRAEELQVDLVGMHGQTVYHEHRYATVQLGDPAFLAAALACPVVADFRSHDIAVGGCGAPLVPIVDQWLFGSTRDAIVCLNLGGISNVTTLIPDENGQLEVNGFDCGPGNMILDELARRFTRGSLGCDLNGAFAAKGRAREPWLRSALQHSFFAQVPPRSAGREEFGSSFVDEIIDLAEPRTPEQWYDLFATAVELTTFPVQDAILRFVAPLERFTRVVVAGGGTRNPAIMRSLREVMLPAEVITTDELGIPSALKEAIAFALLASARIDQIPTNIPAVTGASKSVLLGKITEI